MTGGDVEVMADMETRGKPDKRLRYVVLLPAGKGVKCFGIFHKFQQAESYASVHGGRAIQLENMYERR